MTPRLATVTEAGTVACLLDRFNREFDTPTPGVAVLTARLQRLLAGPSMFAILTGESAVGVALVSLRANAWYDGPVALLDELFVVSEHRNRGRGMQLLRAAEAEVRRRGGEVLEINLDGQDADTRRFYRRHGYTNVEPGQTEPMLYYYKELTARDIE
jgi:GNAT superfamily N-acetyltransferase